MPESKRKKKERLSLIVFSGDFDKAVAAFTLATGAAAMGQEVNMFFTFWGLNILRKERGRRFKGREFLTRFFNFLMGGLDWLPLSRLNFGGMSPRLMTYLMKKKGVATLDEMIEAAKALKIKLIACEMAMHILDIDKSDLIDEIEEVVGVPTFLEYSRDAETIFIS
ncbi:MAG: DsrE/DsrF/DrsH-like family protein [bacterium]